MSTTNTSLASNASCHDLSSFSLLHLVNNSAVRNQTRDAFSERFMLNKTQDVSERFMLNQTQDVFSERFMLNQTLVCLAMILNAGTAWFLSLSKSLRKTLRCLLLFLNASDLLFLVSIFCVLLTRWDGQASSTMCPLFCTGILVPILMSNAAILGLSVHSYLMVTQTFALRFGIALWKVIAYCFVSCLLIFTLAITSYLFRTPGASKCWPSVVMARQGVVAASLYCCFCLLSVGGFNTYVAVRLRHTRKILPIATQSPPCPLSVNRLQIPEAMGPGTSENNDVSPMGNLQLDRTQCPANKKLSLPRVVFDVSKTSIQVLRPSVRDPQPLQASLPVSLPGTVLSTCHTTLQGCQTSAPAPLHASTSRQSPPVSRAARCPRRGKTRPIRETPQSGDKSTSTSRTPSLTVTPATPIRQRIPVASPQSSRGQMCTSRRVRRTVVTIAIMAVWNGLINLPLQTALLWMALKVSDRELFRESTTMRLFSYGLLASSLTNPPLYAWNFMPIAHVCQQIRQCMHWLLSHVYR